MSENYLKKELYNLINHDTSIFDFIQSGSLDGIWYWDLENPEHEWMSSKFWETLGYDPKEKEHLASEWQDIIFQEDLKLAMDNFEKHFANRTHPFDQIVRYKHKNNSTVWIRCRGMAIRDENGQPIRMLGAHTDITDLKKAEKEITRLSEEYEKVFNGTQDAMFLIKVSGDNKFRYIRNNLAHQHKTQISLQEFMNKSPHEVLGREIGNVVSDNYQKCVETKTCITYEEELDLPGGNRIWSTTLTPILEDNRTSYIVGSSTDVTEQKKLELELKYRANYDKLTEIPNRSLFFEKLEEIIKESEQNKEMFAMLFLDLDGYKAINDNYGHAVGDKVLITVAKRLLENIKGSDVVARMGGDEFMVIIQNIRDLNVLDKMVEKMHKNIQEVMYIDNLKCNIDSSIGIAIFPNDGNDSGTLFRNADFTMYKIKKKGKGGYQFYEST
ncbi:Cyclic di-GMP phosphodiesterase Gmr [Paraliobacillus sp. PM-2]|uniref:sensor domain-containing diguanylate cyclase n=1 Tax=Paraliobacillus sp. PM-2 TaxID=1462524 RepID=UPI00061CD933|nr:sensor domain-containing diguanylate cyclase [Paraliobacillus sp. PM-2]CQR47312.1 Cyclic di-GMP phosphodiesterase Gmr [Paraliobacillus sp. PM-2]